MSPESVSEFEFPGTALDPGTSAAPGASRAPGTSSAPGIPTALGANGTGFGCFRIAI